MSNLARSGTIDLLGEKKKIYFAAFSDLRTIGKTTDLLLAKLDLPHSLASDLRAVLAQQSAFLLAIRDAEIGPCAIVEMGVDNQCIVISIRFKPTRKVIIPTEVMLGRANLESEDIENFESHLARLRSHSGSLLIREWVALGQLEVIAGIDRKKREKFQFLFHRIETEPGPNTEADLYEQICDLDLENMLMSAADRAAKKDNPMTQLKASVDSIVESLFKAEKKEGLHKSWIQGSTSEGFFKSIVKAITGVKKGVASEKSKLNPDLPPELTDSESNSDDFKMEVQASRLVSNDEQSRSDTQTLRPPKIPLQDKPDLNLQRTMKDAETLWKSAPPHEELTELRALSRQMINSFRSREDHLLEEIRNRDEALQKKTLASNRMKDQLDQLSAEKERLQSGAASSQEYGLSEKLHQTQRLLVIQQSTNAQLNRSVEDLKSKVQDLQAKQRKRDSATADSAVTQAKLIESQRQIEELKRSHQLALDRLSNAMKGSKSTESNDLSKKLNSTLQTVNDQRRKLEKTEREMAEFQQTIDYLRGEIKRLQEELNTARGNSGAA